MNLWPPHDVKALMERGLYPMARATDLPTTSIAIKFHPGKIDFRELVMSLASPKVSWSKILSIGSTSESLHRANFLEALAMPLQLKERHFMGEN